MNRKNIGIAFGALCGLAALTATAAEIFYDISSTRNRLSI